MKIHEEDRAQLRLIATIISDRMKARNMSKYAMRKALTPAGSSLMGPDKIDNILTGNDHRMSSFLAALRALGLKMYITDADNITQ